MTECDLGISKHLIFYYKNFVSVKTRLYLDNRVCVSKRATCFDLG